MEFRLVFNSVVSGDKQTLSFLSVLSYIESTWLKIFATTQAFVLWLGEKEGEEVRLGF